MKAKIGYKQYKILPKKPILYNNVECWGLCESDTAMIHINPDIHPEDMRATIWHEILHGFEDFMSITLSEEQIEALSKALTLFIKENPELMKQLVSSAPFKLTATKEE